MSPTDRDVELSGARMAVLRSRVDGVTRKMANALLRAGRSGVLNRQRTSHARS